MTNPVALITSHPFASQSDRPLQLMREAGFEVRENPVSRKLTSAELAAHIEGVDVLIAGVERIDARVFERANRLKLISRVGVGLDGIDFALCSQHGVRVSYTPDAPTVAVAELNVALTLDLLRGISRASAAMAGGEWRPFVGGQLGGLTVGIVGFGRIGQTTAKLLSGFGVRLIAQDPIWDTVAARIVGVERVERNELLTRAHVVILCLPLLDSTEGSFGAEAFSSMRDEAVIVNAARGGIIDETALVRALDQGWIAGAALDVFEKEPYSGPLQGRDDVVLTCHMGGSTGTSRELMEVGAVQEALRFIRGEALRNEIAESPYAGL